MKDSLGFSLLSYAAYKNDSNCFKVLFAYGSGKISANELQVWADHMNSHGFNALHYAA